MRFMRICVYGAASPSIHSDYFKAVEELGRKIAERGHSIVYGAGARGLMGAVARGVYEKGGDILGVAPKFFNVDGALFENCTELIRTDTMRERKKIMEERADAFIMLPGGIGTFDEFFEILTLKQLKRHDKAMAVFNVRGYYNAMLDMMNAAVSENFLQEKSLTLYEVLDTADDVLDYIEQYTGIEFSVEEMRAMDMEENKE